MFNPVSPASLTPNEIDLSLVKPVPLKRADRILISEEEAKEGSLSDISKQLGQGQLVGNQSDKSSAEPMQKVKFKYAKGEPFVISKDYLNEVSARYLEKAETIDSGRFYLINSELEKVKKLLMAEEKANYDRASFDIAASYLSTLYVCNPYDESGRFDGTNYGKAFSHLKFNFEKVHVKGYFELCLKLLPQEIVQDLGERVSEYLINKSDGFKRWEGKEFILPICSHAKHASINMLFVGAYFNDFAIMERCLCSKRANYFSCNAIGLNPLQIASRGTIEKLMKAGEHVLIQQDIDFANDLEKQRAGEHKEFAELPPRISSKADEAAKAIPGQIDPAFKMHSYYVIEETLVKLKDPTMRYNANYVFDGFGIASEAPSKKTEPAFWQMIWETGTDNIVMLTDFVQSSLYFKDGKYGNFTVKALAKPKIIITNGTQSLLKRVLQISDGKETKTITHWHVDQWPDGGVVPPTFLADVVRLLASEIKEGKIKRMLTHCMAGIGRTGTFKATLQSYLDFLGGKKGAGLVHNNVLKLRKQRNGSVQTNEQYSLIYSAFAILQAEVYLKSRLKGL